MSFVSIVGETEPCHSLYKVVTLAVCLEQKWKKCGHFGGKSKSIFRMEESDVLFEIQAQLASYDGSIRKDDLWRFYDVFYQNLENRSISYLSVIDMTILLLKKHSENQRLFYESASCKMEESLVTYYSQLTSAREASNYIQKMFDLIKEYCRVFWLSSILIDQFLAFFSKVVSWLHQNSDTSLFSTVGFYFFEASE